ncbi:MAG: PTS sugar transporter subunit IIA [Gammaproteobacteria bacterium]
MTALSEGLTVEDILLGVQVASKQQLFEIVDAHMQAAHGMPAESVASALQRREQAGSTALGHGIAIPHARVKELDRIRIVYARLVPALPFDAPDGQAVSHVLVLMVPAPATQAHLDILAQVSSLFSDPAFRKALDQCQDPIRIKEVFDRWPS